MRNKWSKISSRRKKIELIQKEKILAVENDKRDSWM